MKNAFFLCYTLAIFVVLHSGCNKEDSPNPTNDEPLVTPIGTSIGFPVSATIDENGGTLSSADGQLQIIIPAGVVSVSTLFSIQPITNQCPGGFGLTYRLSPEGIIFDQSVTIRFSFVDSLLENEKVLAIAYQIDDNTWSAPKAISLNEVDNTVSVQTRHFSDWTLFKKIAILPSPETVKVNGSLALEVIFVADAKIYKDPFGDDIASLFLSKTFASKWEVNGTIGNATVGFITKLDENEATYDAPANVPLQNPVAVSATLNNISFTLNGETFTNPKLVAQITVIGEKGRFFVEFTSSRNIQPVGTSWFTETDRGSMKVLLEDDSVTVYELENANAVLSPFTLYDEVAECTYAVLNAGDGPYHISTGVNFAGEYSFQDDLIGVGISSQNFSSGYTPTFQKSCAGGALEILEGALQATAPSFFTFDITKAYQEFTMVIPGGGVVPNGFLKTTVTKTE